MQVCPSQDKRMTGSEFERKFCDFLFRNGYWALRIPKNESGAQPFDVLAVKKDIVPLAVDCKVCQAPRLSLGRIEPNQWMSMRMFIKRAGCDWDVGFAVYHDGHVYFIPYSEIVEAEEHGMKSVKLDPLHMIIEDFFREVTT